MKTADYRRSSTMSSAEVTWPVALQAAFGESLSLQEIQISYPPLWESPLSTPHPHPHLRPSLAEKLSRLVALDANWDGSGAQTPAPDSIGKVAEFLAALPREIPDPDVIASTTGGVLLEWETDDVELLLSVVGSAFASAVVLIDNDEVEGSVATVRDEIFEALYRLISHA